MMKKTFAVLIGITAGAALTAAIAYSKKGKDLRSELVKKADELRRMLAENVKDNTSNIQDSEFIYI